MRWTGCDNRWCRWCRGQCAKLRGGDGNDILAGVGKLCADGANAWVDTNADGGGVGVVNFGG